MAATLIINLQKMGIQNRLDNYYAVGYSLRLHRNTEPRHNHGSIDRSGVLWDVRG